MGELKPNDLPIIDLARERFVETGYGWGHTLRNLSGVFPRADCIELDDVLYKDALMKWGKIPKVQVLHGNSPEILSLIIDPYVSTLFFLDAHWSGGVHFKEKYPNHDECPLLYELDAILRREWHAPFTIIIDDTRMFHPEYWAEDPEAKNFNAGMWPTEQEIRSRLGDLKVHEGVIPDAWIVRTD